MDATLTIASASWVGPALSRWIVASVGDSPAWLVTVDRVEALTTDHSLAADLVRAGAIDPQDAHSHSGRHILVRALATHDEPRPDLAEVVVEPGQGLVLASDGLAGPLGPTDLRRCWECTASPTSTAKRLVSAAVEAGASDNVTVAVLRHFPM
jgi:protein phosphatase